MGEQDDCRLCKGRGWIAVDDGSDQGMQVHCPNCKGEGSDSYEKWPWLKERSDGRHDDSRNVVNRKS